MNRFFNQREVDGDASESAILRCMESLIGNVHLFRARHPKTFEIPFNSTNKFQVSVHKYDDKDDPRLLVVMKVIMNKKLDLVCVCSFFNIQSNQPHPHTVAAAALP